VLLKERGKGYTLAGQDEKKKKREKGKQKILESETTKLLKEQDKSYLESLQKDRDKELKKKGKRIRKE